jgi:L-serine dehydratase
VDISIFELFKIGIGPSSSHTVGPMRAARAFVLGLAGDGLLAQTASVQVELYGSLALTGKGHGTDRAVLLGLEGEAPDAIDPDTIDARLATIRTGRAITLAGQHRIPFEELADLVFRVTELLPEHTNGLRLTAFDAARQPLRRFVYYSVGGGFITSPDDATVQSAAAAAVQVPHPFGSADELLRMAAAHNCTIADIMLENERTWRTDEEIRRGILRIWDVMRACAQRGLVTEGILPGGLNVTRRAPRLSKSISTSTTPDHLDVLDWVNVYAMAVNEENAAGGRVVTAPTNGAAGLIPAVVHYYTRFVDRADDEGVVRFFLTAGAIGLLYKKNASISGAEVGCQGEVGVACSMAAGGLVAALGGSNDEIEQAAEIGMEHHLGLTCDPVGGLVQIPCIERNAVGGMKAINAARRAMRGDGVHKVSLDQVIETMRETGRDMQSRYKETALGGLALHVIEC